MFETRGDFRRLKATAVTALSQVNYSRSFFFLLFCVSKFTHEEGLRYTELCACFKQQMGYIWSTIEIQFEVTARFINP